MIDAPKGYEPRNPPHFDGGSTEDRKQLLELYYKFRIINDALDAEGLRSIWSAKPQSVFFNSNGHTYYGLEDWLKIWDHYRPRLFVLEPGGSGSIHILIHGDMAVIIDDHSGHSRVREWRGQHPVPAPSRQACSRVTMVCMREGSGWKVVHAHFSIARHEPRPDEGGRE